MKEEFKKLNTKQFISAWKEFLDSLDGDYEYWDYYKLRTWKKVNFPYCDSIPERMDDFNEKNPYFELRIDDFYREFDEESDDYFDPADYFADNFDPTDDYFLADDEGLLTSLPDWRMAEEIKHFIRTLESPAIFNWTCVCNGFLNLEDFTDAEIISMAMRYGCDVWKFADYFQNRFDVDLPEDVDIDLTSYYQPYLSLMAAGLAQKAGPKKFTV